MEKELDGFLEETTTSFKYKIASVKSNEGYVVCPFC